MRAAIVGAVMGCLGAPGLQAQGKLPDPRQLRPPLITTENHSDRLKHLAQERLGLLQLAIAAGDTAALSALVPDSAIPDSERTAAARAGCSSLAQSVSRLHAAIERATVGGGPPLAVDRPVVTVAAVGDTATIAATFVAARTARIPVALTVVGNGAALRVAKVNGLAVSACTGATRVGIIQGVARRTMSGGG